MNRGHRGQWFNFYEQQSAESTDSFFFLVTESFDKSLGIHPSNWITGFAAR